MLTGPVLCLALAIYYEANTEPYVGKVAVAQVIMNRVKSNLYPDSICEVVEQGSDKGRRKCQFSFMCDGLKEEPVPGKSWDSAVAVAGHVFSGLAPKVVPKNVLHYHSISVLPNWSLSMKRYKTIGRHIFLIM